jgi:uncharacterized protein YeaC (DUF1315 family)
MEKPDSWQALVAGMTPEVHQSLKTAVELGKWPNGDRLTPAQLEHCMQAVIAYDQLYLAEDQRTAFIDRSGLKKTLCDD